MNQPYELLAAHTSYSHDGKIKVVRHYHQYMTCILGIVFYASYHAEVLISRIVLNLVPSLAASVAVVVRYHESVEAQSHEFVNVFSY